MLKLHLLGERRLTTEGADTGASIRYRKGWALLGYLAVERGRHHPREELAELLWPELSPIAARTNLRQVLADLNHVLDQHGGARLMTVSRDTVGLFPCQEVAIDLQMLEAAEALLLDEPDDTALAAVEQHVGLLGGDFMAGLSLPDCDSYEDWLRLARQRLAASTRELLTRLCRAQQARGRLPQAIISARRLVALDEWNEEHQREFMRLLAAAGLYQPALVQYRTLATSLQTELATTPEPRTQALAAQIEAEYRRGLATPAAGGSSEKALMRRLKHWIRSDPGADDVAASGFFDAPSTLHTRPQTTGSLPARGSGDGWLIVAEGAQRRRRIAITTAPLVIGRSRDNGLCIAHETVSRQHCAIWREGEDFRIRDLGSTNGTRVNDASVQEAELADGDHVVLGETVLRFVRGDDLPTMEDEVPTTR
ncbi:DNA-binding SARP family transcriptional activator [Luteimonas cucumeris]|uniref:DNA-binding SARP family transcriptional activator n=2 Tax=Luteimonas cucumeris TaxID=985012 RepID=A0A562LF34_9GAMM|nr:DNA-binding SARP family transcriptional activator [Luteimonas cucumeris]